MIQQLNYRNLGVATTATTIAGILLLAASFLFNKVSFFLLFNENLGVYADVFFSNITKGGEVIPWVGALVVVLLFRRDFIWLLVACFIISTLFVQGIKNVLPEQPRPTKAITNTYQVHTVKGVELHKEFSFPSGHTATAFTVFFIACLAIQKRWVLPLGFACPVATFDTVLFTDNPNEMGSPVSLITFSRSSAAHFMQPKNLSIPVRSR